MGVKGLWSLVEPAKSSTTLTEFCVQQAIQDGRWRGCVLGIDANIWIVSAQSIFMHRRGVRWQAGENCELKTLFYRLAYLANLPVAAIFVFDGPDRPSVKRNTRVVPKHHFLVTGFKQLIRAFGFDHKDAPGEAEAELASMNIAGYIDAVVTDDSDVLAFGALTVIRNWNLKKDKDQITIFKSGELNSPDGLQLSRAGLILIAVLVGGDYDTAGLEGCGLSTAHALARYGCGESLLAAVSGSPNHRVMALSEWRRDVRDILRKDPLRYLGRRQAKLASSIPETFPDPRTIALYARPVTSGVAQSDVGTPSCLVRAPRPINVRALARHCEFRFAWGSRNGILKTFEKKVWPGVVVREIVGDICAGPDKQNAPQRPYVVKTGPICKRDREHNRHPVTLQLAPYVSIATTALLGLRRNKPGDKTYGDKKELVVRVPAQLAHIVSNPRAPSDRLSRKLAPVGASASTSAHAASMDAPSKEPDVDLTLPSPIIVPQDAKGDVIDLTVPQAARGEVIDLTI